MIKYRIGIDLGGTNIAVGIVDENWEMVARHSLRTKIGRPYPEIIADMAKATHIALGKARLSLGQCLSAGVGNPGTCDSQTGVVKYSNNLQWEDVPILFELKKHLNLPLYLSNDADCAALGEVLAGAAKGSRSAVLLTLGTGVGGGVIIDGRVFSGERGAGAELGHSVIKFDGEECSCGRRGCLEAYASAEALIRDTRRAAEAHPDSLINKLCDGDLSRISGRTAFRAARQGDPVGRKVVDNYLMYLGFGIVDCINIFRPESVIIGGGISNEGEYLLNPLNEYVRKYAFGVNKNPPPPVVLAKLGAEAGIIGAAGLGFFSDNEEITA